MVGKVFLNNIQKKKKQIKYVWQIKLKIIHSLMKTLLRNLKHKVYDMIEDEYLQHITKTEFIFKIHIEDCSLCNSVVHTQEKQNDSYICIQETYTIFLIAVLFERIKTGNDRKDEKCIA